MISRLRPLIDVDGMDMYIEPFVGMGAVYLDVRARGYKGWAKIADSHTDVFSYWMLVHHAPDALVDACRDLCNRPATAESFYAMKVESADDVVERTARFLWLLNFSFGNMPLRYVDGKWSSSGGAGGGGTKLTSAAKWGKTFPWSACVDRLEDVADLVGGTPTTIYEDGVKLLADATARDVVYADPPYVGTSGYTGSMVDNYIDAVSRTDAYIVLSEGSDLAGRLDGWMMHDGDLVARASGGVGADGKRRELIYVRERPPEVYA